jgi:hypothetical protein
MSLEELVALHALIKTALTLVSRVTLQYRVPLKVGSVLGKYSQPRWVLKSYAWHVSIGAQRCRFKA